jgi:two-component system cell cycle sensor histidine kinase PleC
MGEVQASLRDAVDGVAEGFVIYDRDDRLVICNQRYKDLYPESASAMVPGARFEDILRAGLAVQSYPDAAGREEAWLAERLRLRRQARSTIEQLQRNGRWVLTSDRHMQNGGIAGLRIDITELKAAQQEAEAARARMADFADASNDWFWEADPDGNLTYLSAPSEQATGLTVASRMGALRLDITRALDPDNPNWDEHLKAIADRRPFRDFVMTLRVANGVKHLSVSGKPVFDAAGRFLGYRGTTRDVTLQIETDRALARQSDMLSSLIQNLPIGVSLVGPDLRYRAFNRLYVEDFDLPPDFITPGDPIEKLVRFNAERGEYGPGDPDDLVRQHLYRLSNPRPQQLERVRPNGQIFEVRRVPLPDGSCITTRIDVTEHRVRERDLNAAHTRLGQQTEVLSMLIQNLPIAVSLVNADLRYMAFNRPFLDDFDLRPETLKVGDSFEKFARHLAERGEYGPGDVETLVRERMARVKMLREPEQFEATLKNGRIGEVRIVPLPGGGFVSTRVDVTERRLRERDLQRARARLERQTAVFSTLIENLPVGVNMVDLDGCFMAFNQPFLEVFDVPSNKFKVGDSFEAFIRFNAERGEYGPGDIEPKIRQRIEAATRQSPEQFERRRPNGHVIEVRRAAVPGGGFVSTYIDVTEARRREADLEDARLRLERQTAELVATAEKLNAANAAKSLFLANMSHELRTPLNAILGFSEILRDAVIGPLPAKYQEYASDIHTSGAYLLRLINDVLDISKLEVGHQRLDYERVDLDELVSECERLLRQKAHDGGVTILRSLRTGLPALLVDRLRMKQILLNLLSNAVKFTPSGGKISVSMVTPDEGGLSIVVSDTGIGMKAADIPIALEPFRQIDNTFSRRYEGTGLGLPLAKTFTELHGGHLSIESRPGEGTTVRVWLPAARVAAFGQAARNPKA